MLYLKLKSLQIPKIFTNSENFYKFSLGLFCSLLLVLFNNVMSLIGLRSRQSNHFFVLRDLA